MPSSGGDRALAGRLAQLGAALLHDLHGFAHLFHADDLAIVGVAVLPHGDVELHLLVALVGLRLAQVPRDAGAAHHHAREAPGHGLVHGDDADVDVALLEDAVAHDEVVEVVDHLQERVAERLDVVDQRRRQVLVDAAGPEVVGVEARAGRALVEDHQLLALLEAPERRREGADVHRLRGDVEEVREDAADLAEQHADELRRAAAPRARAASRCRGRRRAPGSSARRSRAGRSRASPAGRSCARSASRCRGAAGRYADRRARRSRRRVPARGAARRAPPGAAARS